MAEHVLSPSARKKLALKYAWLVWAGIATLSCGYTRAELTVIYDSGDTLSIAPYLPEKVIQETPTQATQSSLPFKVPISTPSMQPGSVNVTTKALRYLQQPLFLVGSDQRSKNWLLQRREQLKSINAIGLLIEAKDRKDIETMQALAEGLRLVPMSAEGFASKLGLTHYPVLLSKEGWEQ